MTAIPVLPELPGTNGYRTTRHLPREVLNSPQYTSPDASHTYPTVRHVGVSRGSWGSRPYDVTVVHVPGCPKLSDPQEEPDAVPGLGEWTGTGLDLHYADPDLIWCRDCTAHRYHHVVLPDGRRAYRPAGPIGVNGWGDQAWASWAVAAEEDGVWSVVTWTVCEAEAEFIAQGWPTMAVVLDPDSFPWERGEG
ncbi:hypothetical protein [Nonomuraea sp. SYSU D8015]|uniref:hypothetical protein n=1 Tax=Nonomuraea sp. SYSU D8015 TaxID=2593644 RepID=UPI001660E328|nr:hypothetical protein [Nonomuraea sp. SYSU D8015]